MRGTVAFPLPMGESKKNQPSATRCRLMSDKACYRSTEKKGKQCRRKRDRGRVKQTKHNAKNSCGTSSSRPNNRATSWLHLKHRNWQPTIFAIGASKHFTRQSRWNYKEHVQPSSPTPDLSVKDWKHRGGSGGAIPGPRLLPPLICRHN